jgi:hypothetical protein
MGDGILEKAAILRSSKSAIELPQKVHSDETRQTTL